MLRYMGEGKTFTRDEAWLAISGILGHWKKLGYGTLSRNCGAIA